jgi:lipoate-protein ligase A
MMPCHLIVDPPQDGAWNMAVDEALLEDAANRGRASLRFYQWRIPTLSLGYFQPHRARHSHPPSLTAALVRRLSGGGALLHDRELTYSVCLPSTHWAARDSAELYGVVHGALISVLATFGLRASLYGNQQTEMSGDGDPFLCFARRSQADVVLRVASPNGGTTKIVGSAQRRRRGAVLQHGAMLLGTSSFAPDLPGVEAFGGQSLTAGSLIAPCQEALAAGLQLQLQSEPFDGELRDMAHRLQVEKYSRLSWTERR